MTTAAVVVVGTHRKNLNTRLQQITSQPPWLTLETSYMIKRLSHSHLQGPLALPWCGTKSGLRGAGYKKKLSEIKSTFMRLNSSADFVGKVCLGFFLFSEPTRVGAFSTGSVFFSRD